MALASPHSTEVPLPPVQVTTLGETMMVFNGPADAPLVPGALASATFAGAESNLAIGLARLGHSVRWVSALGDDVFGRGILKTIRGEGVDTGHVHLLTGRPTGLLVKSTRGWAEPEVLYYRAGSAFSHLETADFPSTLWQRAGLLFLSGITPALSAGGKELWRHAAKEAHQAGQKVWLDPNYRRKLWSAGEFRETILSLLPLVDMLLPGQDEAELLTGETEPLAQAAALLEHGAAAVTLKCGSRGAYLVTRKEECFVPPFQLEKIVNPIGAGDAFAAGVMSGHLEGLEAAACLARGHALGAMACCQTGDWEGGPDRAALQQFLNGKSGSDR